MEDAVDRRLTGLLLLLAWPGVLSGLSLTAYLLLPQSIAYPVSLANWPLAALGSGVGGYMTPKEAKAKPGAAFCGLLLGAGLYWVSMETVDRLFWTR